LAIVGAAFGGGAFTGDALAGAGFADAFAGGALGRDAVRRATVRKACALRRAATGVFFGRRGAAVVFFDRWRVFPATAVLRGSHVPS
jgi:hypothetical protein